MARCSVAGRQDRRRRISFRRVFRIAFGVRFASLGLPEMLAQHGMEDAPTTRKVALRWPMIWFKVDFQALARAEDLTTDTDVRFAKRVTVPFRGGL